MAVLGGAGDADPNHKLASGGGVHSHQQHAAGNPNHSCSEFEHMENNGSSVVSADSDSHKQQQQQYYYDDAPSVESDVWQSSSASSSTRQMLNGSSRSATSPRPSSSGRRPRRLTAVAFVKKIDWGSLWDTSKEWMRNPVNMALLVWVVAVGVSGAILFMVMTGMLNRVLRTKPQRDTWFEVNNQILNALFTLMCLYQHPRRFYHLVLLCRWRAGDMLQLRQVYCKDGTCKPKERKHMTVVVLLLHLNCFAQYALCGLNLGYRRPKRPVIGVAITISVAICAPAVAGLYNNLSPLGNDYEAQPADDEESCNCNSRNPQHLQRKTTLHDHENAASTSRRGEWIGGVFDVWWDDISLAYLSVFCSCCIFGWNVSRLGFGNMYVHIVTFVLLCLAPFFIFNLAAINIDTEDVRDALGLAGVFLCIFGLLYGGFWRIQMRRRFRLPASNACCGKPDLTDCLQWLCCYSCSLAQEVRTADALLLVLQDGTAPARAAARPVNNGVVTVPPPVSAINSTYIHTY